MFRWCAVSLRVTTMSSSDTQLIPCPTCGQDETNHIPVWELPDTYESGRPPDYMGCVECHTMRPYEEWR